MFMLIMTEFYTNDMKDILNQRANGQLHFDITMFCKNTWLAII